MDLLNLLGLSLIFYLSRIAVTYGEDVNYREDMGHIYTTIFHKYSERVRPFSNNNEPVHVGVLVKLIKINDFDLLHKELDFTADLTVNWMDSRLYWYSEHIKYITVNYTNIWTPDIHFLDALSPPVKLIYPRFLLVESDGNIVWYRRLRVKTHCETNITADVQNCAIRLGSHQFPIEDLDFDNVRCLKVDYFHSRKWQVSLTNNITEIVPLLHDAFSKETNRSEAICTVDLQNITPVQPTTPTNQQLVDTDDTNRAGRLSFELFIFIFVAILKLIC